VNGRVGAEPYASDGLVGRASEREYLADVLAGLPASGRAIVLRGDPGVGKTTLLNHLARLAVPRCRVRRIGGVESEATLAFAALGELLVPLAGHFPALPPAQRESLDGALALGAGSDRVNPYAVCVAALNVLSLAGQQQPLVVLIDDLQWVDPDSLRVFQFLARRISAEPVLLVAASREHQNPPAGIAAVDVRELTEPDCQQILQARGLTLAPRVFRALMAFSRGNPLILLEYATRLTAEQRSGAHPLPSSPEVGDDAERGWFLRLDALPLPARRALTVVAAARDAPVDLIQRALRRSGLSIDDLRPAEQSRLVAVAGRGYELVHPIVRTVALKAASVLARRDAYRALAGESTGAERAWYLSAAAVAPDEEIAGAGPGRARSPAVRFVPGRRAGLAPGGGADRPLGPGRYPPAAGRDRRVLRRRLRRRGGLV
jgi:energy-coupling factor transporter ATP-binding protein EcfA2